MFDRDMPSVRRIFFQRWSGVCIHVRKPTVLCLSVSAGDAIYWIANALGMQPDPRMTEDSSSNADENRRIEFDGPLATELPESGVVARADGVRFILHPPLDFEIGYRVADYLVFTPYSRAIVDVSVKDGPRRRKAWAAGSAFVVPPETSLRAKMAEPVEFLCIAFSADRAEAIIDRAAQGRPWSPELIEDFVDPGLAALQQEVRRSLLGDPIVEPAYLSALADAVMARIGCHLAGVALGAQPKESLSPGLLRRIVDLIEDRLGDKLLVETLANDAGLSRSHFSRAFHAATGQSPQEFIIGRRISRARELLANTDEPVGQIAAATGFSSQAHLSTAFKKRLGVSPARYRESFRREQA